MIRKFLAVFSACLLLCICAACAPKEKESEPPEGSANTGAPIIFPDAPAEFESVQFETTDLQGNAQSQSIFQENELTMVNIWATWCAPCIEEMPVLEQIYQEGEIGVVGIVIESREEEVAQLALEITTQTGATFPILRVTEDMEEGFLSGISAMPTTFFVDAEGNVVGGLFIGSRGELEWKDTVASVQEELNEGA